MHIFAPIVTTAFYEWLATVWVGLGNLGLAAVSVW